MTLTPRFLLVLSLFQISLGLGWILGYVFLPPTVFCYEWAAERSLAGEYRHVHPEGLNAEDSIVLQPYDYFNNGKTAQLPVVSLHRESSLNSFATYPPNPMDYTVLFRHLYEQGAKNVYVMAPLAWDEEPDSIVKAAVGYELDRFPHKALGRQMSESSRHAPLPPDWKKLAVPAANIVGKADRFPRADRLVGESPQLVTAARTLGTTVENNELFSPAPEDRVSPPLFVRWGGDIIPTLPLVAALNALDLKPGDVKIIPGETLFLGNKRSIPLDEYGRIPLAEHSSPTMLDTKEVIVPVMSGLRPPDTTAVRKLLSSADAVIVSEPSALSETPDAQALLSAQTIRSIMGSLAPAPPVLIPAAPAWVQWVIVLDVLLLAVWALRFQRRGRFIIWGLCMLAAPVIAWYLFSVHDTWFPVMTPVTGVLCVALAGCLFPWLTPPSGNADEEEEEDGGTPPADGSGAGHVLPPDNLYQEPNEVPIPHHSKR
ncbi:hypothetical protein [Akkermansia sp.]|uniref:hypothetical protein n=1 Tax=Akkermansia sp. TaxID=1872421 RepID=UPI0025BECC77|nr:hypothetical protein [Akkermansia sp.]